VHPVESRLAVVSVLLHMAPMAQHFQIRWPLILLIPVFVMDA
jgi:hypothetical protein